MIGMLDHEMDVERQTRELANSRDNSRSEGNVIDEMSVHNVAMNPIGPGVLNPVHFIGQSGKIGGQDGGGDQNASHGVMEYWSIEQEYITPSLHYSTLRPPGSCSQLSLDGRLLCSNILRVLGC
jgi:hypothetical protein